MHLLPGHSCPVVRAPGRRVKGPGQPGPLQVAKGAGLALFRAGYALRWQPGRAGPLPYHRAGPNGCQRVAMGPQMGSGLRCYNTTGLGRAAK